MTIHSPWSERGYAMAALLVAMAVMAIVLSTAMPVYQTVARREREAELIFRGEQYARAIGMFQRKYANALPPDVDVLVKERFLRKKYKDPITRGDFQFLGPSSPELAKAMGSLPQQVQDAQRGRGAGARGSGPTTTPQTDARSRHFKRGARSHNSRRAADNHRFRSRRPFKPGAARRPAPGSRQRERSAAAQ